MSACGGWYVSRVSDGVYEITCERCGALNATGPAEDVHWAAQTYRDLRCDRAEHSDQAGAS